LPWEIPFCAGTVERIFGRSCERLSSGVAPSPDPFLPPESRLAHVADASYVGGVVKTLSVKLPEPLAKWLIDEANSTRRSRSDLVREALELRRQGNGRTPKKRITMVDAMADLRGSVSGPTDLSSNPKYFADFCK
jgi:Arc/MetJ-type ribon-helix-helix transcriptional regulator